MQQGIVMRAWQLAAVLAATMTTHVAPATAETLVPAGLGGGTDTGGVLGVTAQPGTPFRTSLLGRLGELSPVVLFAKAKALDPAPHLRRVGRMMDFYPDADIGLHFSAGMQVLRRWRGGFAPDRDTSTSALIYSPAFAGRMPMRTNINRVAPAATVGWTSHLSSMAVFGIEAGTVMQHGGMNRSAAAIAQPLLRTAAWSGINPTARASFALKF